MRVVKAMNAKSVLQLPRVLGHHSRTASTPGWFDPCRWHGHLWTHRMSTEAEVIEFRQCCRCGTVEEG
jgi:hypothetical protein